MFRGESQVLTAARSISLVMFSKVDELLDTGEELQRSVNPSAFDTKYVKTLLTALGLFLGVSILLAANTIFSLGLSTGLLVLLYVLPVIFLLKSSVERRMVMYHFTDREIIEEEGFFDKDFNSIPYERIQDVVLDEELEERIFDVGDLHIRTAGTDNSEQVLNGLRDPESYKVVVSRRSSSTSKTSTSDESSGSGGGSNPVDAQALEEELERVESQLNRLDQRSNMQGLSSSEKQRWYKLEGQRELIERLKKQEEKAADSGLNL